MIVIHCDLWAKSEEKGEGSVIRFNLTRTQSRNGKTTTRGAGSIWLCAACWNLMCKPRTRRVQAIARKVRDAA